MRNLSLTTKMILSLSLAGLFGLGVALSYYFQNKTQNRIEAAFRQDLAIVAKLSKLRGQLRSNYYLVSLYLNTGSPKWLKSVESSEQTIQALLAETGRMMTFSERKETLNDLHMLIGRHLAEEQKLMDYRRSGRLGAIPDKLARERKEKYDSMVDVLGFLSDIDTTEIERWRAQTEMKNLTAIFVLLCTGIAGCGILGIVLYFYIIKPVLEFQANAQRWSLGADWQYQKTFASPEIQSLNALMKDVTDRLNREYRNKCDLADFKTQLVSMVGHEFNNSLSIISTARALLKERDGKAEENAELYRIIEGHSDILGVSIKNLLNLGRLESGKLAVSRQKIAINQIIQRSVGLLELLWQEKQVAVHLVLPHEPVVVLGDQSALSLVISNLVSNAVKYTPKGGSVEVGLRTLKESAEAEIYVKDTGIGIAPEDRDKVLSGFYRASNSRHMAKGFGVGLMLVSMILEGHDSSLEVDSELGKGSRFSFRLALQSVSLVPGGGHA